ALPGFLRGQDPEPELIQRLFLASSMRRTAEFPALLEIAGSGLPPLGEHREMFDLISKLNRDITGGIGEAISRSIDAASFTGLFDAISAALAQQFVLLPYYFALFHQNKERHLLRQITAREEHRSKSLKVGLFTDTLCDMNG